MATEDADRKADFTERLRHEGVELLRFFGGALLVYLAITTVLFRTFYIPSSSMEPTLEVQDRVLVLNFVYGWSRHSLPFGLGSVLPDGEGRLLQRMPSRGDVIVFRHPRPDNGTHLIKRVVGVPGDRVEIESGRLYINGELVPRELQDTVRYRDYRKPHPVVTAQHYVESLPEGPDHAIYERSDSFDADGAAGKLVYNVPSGRLFVMGDNRDQSQDSRSDMSYVPIENVVGKAVTVLFTFKRCKREPGLHCPTGRVWRPL